MPRKTKFATESAKGGETEESQALATTGPSKAMLALFANRPAPSVLDNLVRVNLPQMVKPKEKNGRENMPVGFTLSGLLIDVVPSPKASIKDSLLWLHVVTWDDKGNPQASGTEITFPASGSIRNALAPGIDRKDQDKAREKMLAHKGKILVLTRVPDKHNTEFNKDMYIFDVRLSPKAVDLGVKVH